MVGLLVSGTSGSEPGGASEHLRIVGALHAACLSAYTHGGMRTS